MNITPRMHEILTLMSNGENHNIGMLTKGLHMPKNGDTSETLKFFLRKLIDLGLIEVNEGSSDSRCTRWIITREGKKAQAKGVTSSAIDYKPTPLIDRKPYVPSGNFYQRNNGHTHIGSYGFKC